MQCSPTDWDTLRQLRERFLHPAPGDYWQSDRQIELYDRSFAERIGDKWRAVLQEVATRAAEFPGVVWDWGCGTAMASRTWCQVLGAEGAGAVTRVYLTDRSARVLRFAEQKLRDMGVEVQQGEPPPGTPYTLLASHVSNELDDRGRESLHRAMSSASAVVRVEPGTPQSASDLLAMRETLRPRFEWLAPCPHQSACGMLRHAADWCHHFAPVSPEVFTSGFWRLFSEKLGIDLRSLPVSYLVGVLGCAAQKPASNRIVGRPNLYKGYVEVQVCRASGVSRERIRTSGHKAQKQWKEPCFVRRHPSN